MESVMESAASVLGQLGSAEHITGNPGDFVGEDGLMRCRVCGTAKEYRIPATGRYVGCICKCEQEKINAEKAEDELKRELHRARELASYSLVDERFYESTFDRFVATTMEDQRVLRICRNYVEHFDDMLANSAGLLFYGSPGTGKTFAASCIANALIEKRVPVLVTSIVRLTANMFGDDLNELLYRMNTARLLVLDDFGAERETSTKAEQVFSVIDARYSSKKPMIITTNLVDFNTETDVRRKRVYDRIFEVCTPIKMDGKSKRFQEGQKRRESIRAILEG